MAQMSIVKKVASGALILVGLGALGYFGGMPSPTAERRVSEGLDLSLNDPPFELADLGGGYGRYAFPAKRQAARPGGYATFWRNNDRTPADSHALLLPYAGVGLGPFKLSMDMRDLDVWLAKDKSSRRSRAFAGIGYAPLPNLNLNLEYRALADGEPLFAVDLGNLSLNIDNPFEVQTVALKVNYRF